MSKKYCLIGQINSSTNNAGASFGLLICVIGHTVDYAASIGDETIQLNDYWGKMDTLHQLIKSHNVSDHDKLSPNNALAVGCA